MTSFIPFGVKLTIFRFSSVLSFNFVSMVGYRILLLSIWWLFTNCLLFCTLLMEKGYFLIKKNDNYDFSMKAHFF